jgi:hypothetical protein
MREQGACNLAYRRVAGATGFCRRTGRILCGMGLIVLLSTQVVPAQPMTPVGIQRSPSAVADSLRADSLAQANSKKTGLRADTAKVVMHHFNHKQQIITGGSIMACLIGIMVVMNNYNPRVPL